MNFIKELSKKRQRWIEANQENNFEDGIKNLLTELYPDNAHFIYELLQNAEDTQATKVKFVLDSQSLSFQHNGKQQFTKKDIENITGIGNTLKKGDVRKIGEFGVGFKAVFSYTNNPRIYSGQWAFEINDLVCPKEIGQIPEIAKQKSTSTYFHFPFNHLQKSKEAAFEEIKKTIENLPPNTILFLQHIEEIQWEIEKEKKQIGFIKRSKMTKPNCFEIKKKTDKLYKTYWLRFTKKIPQKRGLFVAIAFRLIPKKTKRGPKKVNYKIDGEIQKGDVSIFFPADKEISNLRFYLHAPFAATVARDSIKSQSENIELRDLLVELLIESFPNIKKFGLLDRNFLSILPNDEDEIPEFYEPFRDKIIETFQDGSYIPTWNNSFSPAKNLLQSASEIKKVINRKNILNHLVEKENVNWVIDADKGSRIHNFLTSLKIEEWTWQELLEKVGELFSDKDIANKILISFPDEWLKYFYVLLGKAKEKTSYYYWNRYEIADANIVRLQDGTHIAGKNTYFQTELIKNIKNLPIVKPEIYQSSKNKNQNEKAEKFLRDLGVKEFEEKDEIKIILDKHYKDNLIDDTKEHIKHLRKFISFLRKNSAEKFIFSTYDFLIAEEDDAEIYYCKPSEVFIDVPYEKTNLSSIEKFLIKDFKWKLWSGYSKKIKNQKEFIRFLKDIGVNFNLEIKSVQISNNPSELLLKQDLTRTREISYTSINRDYYIENLDEMLKQKNRAISQLVWKTMSEVDRTILQAKYRPNQRYGERIAPSQIVHTLKQYAWIPDKEGNFYEPQEVTLEMLPDDFPINKSNGWLSAIGLGTQTEKSKLNEQQKLERLAKQLNLTVEQLEKAKEYAKMSDVEKAEFEKFKQQKTKKESEKEVETNTEKEDFESTSSETENDENKEDEEEKRIRNKQLSLYQATQLVEARYGQGIFRANVEKIENKCRLTDVDNKGVLIASHIKPWRTSTDSEKLDGNNGFLLSPHVDKLFDKGLIAFTDEGKIICANDEVRKIMGFWKLDINKFIGFFNEEQKKYLAYHRENIFKSK